MYSLDVVANFMRKWLRNMFPLIFSKLRAFGASVHHTNFSHLQLSPSANRRMGAQTHEILHSQWRFTISSLSATPSATTSAMTRGWRMRPRRIARIWVKPTMITEDLVSGLIRAEGQNDIPSWITQSCMGSLELYADGLAPANTPAYSGRHKGEDE